MIIDNGAKTLGQAETWFGAARGIDNAVIALLGIGVGTSIISNRQLYRGATSSAGEWGHTTVVVDGRKCRCGALGCPRGLRRCRRHRRARYDELAGRRRRTRQADLEKRIDQMLATRATDETAAQVLDEAATYLGVGIANLANLFNPQRVVVGGWLGQRLGEVLLPQIRGAAERNALRLPFSQSGDRPCGTRPGRGRPRSGDAAGGAVPVARRSGEGRSAGGRPTGPLIHPRAASPDLEKGRRRTAVVPVGRSLRPT